MLPARYVAAYGEVVEWKFNLLARQQLFHMAVEEFEVDGLDVLEVVVALFVARREYAVHEIVVE